MTPFSITCETCRAQLSVTSKRAIGQILSCPKCRSMVHVMSPSGDSGGSQAEGGVGKSTPAAGKPTPQTKVAQATSESPVSGEPVLSREPRVPAEKTALDPNAAPISVPPPISEPASWANRAESRGRQVAFMLAIGGLTGLAIGAAFVMWRLNRPSTKVASVDDLPIDVPTANEQGIPVEPLKDDTTVSPKPADPVSGSSSDRSSVSPARTGPLSSSVDVGSSDETESSDRPVANAFGPEERPNIATEQQSDVGLLDVDRTDESIGNNLPETVPQVAIGPPGNLPRTPTAASPFVLLAPPDPSVGLADISNRLELPILQMEVRRTPLASFLDDVSDTAGVPISVDPMSLAGAGATLFTPVSATIGDVTVSVALESVLSKIGLRYVVRGSHLSIVIDQPNLRRVEFAVDDLCRGFNPVKQARDLSVVVQQLVAPTTWKVAGGDGTIGVRDTTLRILHRPTVHFQVHRFLDQLRVARGLQARPDRPSGRPAVPGPGLQTEHGLAKRISITLLDWMTIEQARKEWQRISGLTILVDWKSLEDRGITPRSRIRCSVIDQPFGEALTSILQPLGLCWIAVEDGAIQIISHEQALATRETAIYDVSNFISRDGTPSGAAGAMTGTLKRRVAATLGDQAAESTIVRTDSTGGRLIVAAPQAVHRRLAVLFRPEK